MRHKEVVCSSCLEHLTPLGHKCLTCALPLFTPTDTYCGACIQHPPALDEVITAYAYTAPLRFLIHEFKYHEGYFLTNTLSQLLLQALPKNYTTDCLLPVPMHTQRLKERGFHHTEWLAQAISRHTKFPVEKKLCKKIYHTQSSAQLNAADRKRNNIQAYQATLSPYTHITLIDDLITTGETANTIAKLLKQNGTQKVTLWCCARALKI